MNTPACRSQPFSISYDDSARTTVFSYEPGGIGTCILLTTSASYDAAGLLIRVSTMITGAFAITSTSNVVVGATAQVCK